jgi:hypothetical protein
MYGVTPHPHSLQEMKNNTEREILVVFQGELHYVIKCIHVQVSCGEEKKTAMTAAIPSNMIK